MSASKVYGIDLGTTYSCIAHVDEHGKPVVIQNAEGSATTPSVVFFESENNIVVGQAAKEVASIHADQCVSTVKRAMGDATWVQEFYGQSYRPQDISSFILRKVVKDAEAITGDAIRDVVITCPAYFGINEKEATKQAGELAGLNVKYVIPEPTAAALAYGMEQEEDQVVLVYDLGGGTFDVTVIQVQGNEINVICTGGDHELGGKDWDDAIVAHLTQCFEDQTGTSADALLEDLEIYQELLNDAEQCKKSLSTRENITVPVRFQGERVKVEFSREKFDELTAPLLHRTLEMTRQVLEKAREKGFDTIDKMLLVGGSTYMPQIQAAVGQEFPMEVRQYDPNQAVAKGAAIFGYKCFLDEEIKIHLAEKTGQAVEDVTVSEAEQALVDEAQEEVARQHGMPIMRLKGLVDKQITNVTSKSFGMIAYNSDDREVVFNLIKVDDPVPKSVTSPFYTLSEGQTGVDLECRENTLTTDQVAVEDCEAVGETQLSFGKALPKGSPIEVTFDLSADGLLKVHGRDVTTGNEIDAEFRTDSIMSREQVESSKSRNLSLDVT